MLSWHTGLCLESVYNMAMDHFVCLQNLQRIFLVAFLCLGHENDTLFYPLQTVEWYNFPYETLHASVNLSNYL